MKIMLLTGQTFDLSKELGINIKVVSSLSAKKLTLRIDEKERIPVLTLPKFCSPKKALAFVKSNHDWIINMLAKLPCKKYFEEGDSVCFLGDNYTIEHSEKIRGTIFEKSKLMVGGNKEFLHRRVCDFLKDQALKKLADMTIEKAEVLGCKVRNITIKDTKTRWGSCSTLGNINYNWRVVMAPLYVVDYLVCHEVCHLKHPNHSKEFWQEMKTLCPDYVNGRKWLKIKGKDLYKYI